jgi:hypothetical protein
MLVYSSPRPSIQSLGPKKTSHHHRSQCTALLQLSFLCQEGLDFEVALFLDEVLLSVNLHNISHGPSGRPNSQEV